MADTQLRNDYIKVEKVDDRVSIYVCDVRWSTSHTPESVWVSRSRLAPDSSDQQIEEAVDSLLKNKRYFRKCRECKEQFPVGCMHDSNLCHHCAEIILHIVY